MFVNLIEKYGVVPQTVMPETHHSSKSNLMNYFLTHKLKRICLDFKKNEHREKPNLARLRRSKENMISTIYSMLCMFLGNPPEKFNWEVRNKKK